LQPFCDGESHVGTDFTPTTFTVKDRQKVAFIHTLCTAAGVGSQSACADRVCAQWILLCGCKRTTSAPYCDGSHIHIDWAALEW
jgi:CDGSH-type Zn-finger protein